MKSLAGSSGPLNDMVQTMTRLSGQALGESAILAKGQQLMRNLVARDDWLRDIFAQPHPDFYRQYLLHADPLGRFSIVSFVWGPGQQTPIHDHTVWGIIGMLRGAEISQAYAYRGGAVLPVGKEHRLDPGEVESVSPTLGDIHRVRNAFSDQASISIHMYGGNIGEIRRHVFDASTGTVKPFVSGYSNSLDSNMGEST